MRDTALCLQLGKRRNGFFRALTEEFNLCCKDDAYPDKRHDPGQDAYMCARLFLHYNEAGLVKSSACEIDESPIKNPRAGPL